MRRYAEEGIEIPYNKLDLTVKNAVELRASEQNTEQPQQKALPEQKVDHLAQVLAPVVQTVK